MCYNSLAELRCIIRAVTELRHTSCNWIKTCVIIFVTGLRRVIRVVAELRHMSCNWVITELRHTSCNRVINELTCVAIA